MHFFIHNTHENVFPCLHVYLLIANHCGEAACVRPSAFTSQSLADFITWPRH